MAQPLRLLPPNELLVTSRGDATGPLSRWLQSLLRELHAALCPPKTIVSCYLTAADIAANFDGTGLGLRGGPYQWWAICNGNNSTPDFEDRFPRGSVTVAGGTGGSTTSGTPSATFNVTAGALPVAAQAHTHEVTPPYVDVVYLMRVAEV